MVRVYTPALVSESLEASFSAAGAARIHDLLWSMMATGCFCFSFYVLVILQRQNLGDDHFLLFFVLISRPDCDLLPFVFPKTNVSRLVSFTF